MLSIKSELVAENDVIPFKVFHSGGREHYSVRLSTEADPSTLARIEEVEYVLHPSFKNRRRGSRARGDNFAVSIWTWGMFDIEAIVRFRGGDVKRVHHYVKYSLPADTGENYRILS